MKSASPKATRSFAPVTRSPRKLLTFFLVASLSCWPLLNRAQAAAGNLDPTFGSGGKVTTDFFGRKNAANALAIQADGKLIAAGSAEISFPAFDFALARYNTNGSLDSTFGSGGKVTTDFFGQTDAANAVAIQPDGKIIAAGIASNNTGTSSNFALARYNTDGSLDATFGSGGKVITAFPDNFPLIYAIALQPDGKIVAVGIGGLNLNERGFALARYNSDGSLDSSFGSGGQVVTVFFNRPGDRPLAVAIQPDGKIIAAGSTSPSGVTDLTLVRYNTDGSLDATFGSGGKVMDNFVGGISAAATGLALKPDGKIIAAGYVSYDSRRSDFALIRYNSDGSADQTFGVGGKVSTDFSGMKDFALGIVRQPNGKLILAGSVFRAEVSDPDVDFALAGYNDDGSLDTTFGLNGKMTTDFFGARDSAFAIVLQTDGRVVAAGEAVIDSLSSKFALARYDGFGSNFDICLRDDVNENLFQFNSTNGNYLFSNCRKGFTLSGRGVVRIRSCKIELQASEPDRNISAVANSCAHTGSATIRVLSQGTAYSISDSDITNNTCACR